MLQHSRHYSRIPASERGILEQRSLCLDSIGPAFSLAQRLLHPRKQSAFPVIWVDACFDEDKGREEARMPVGDISTGNGQHHLGSDPLHVWAWFQVFVPQLTVDWLPWNGLIP